MAAQKILRIGSPLLRKWSSPLQLAEINSPNTRRIVKDLAATLKERGGWGISAPQIGVQKNIIIMDIPSDLSNFDPWPFTVLYNPRIEILMASEMNYVWEECHSVPGLVGMVPRHHKCAVFWTDEALRERRALLTGTHAAIIQHEYDHLTGKLFVDIMKDYKQLYTLDEWKTTGVMVDGPCLGGDVRFPR